MNVHLRPHCPEKHRYEERNANDEKGTRRERYRRECRGIGFDCSQAKGGEYWGEGPVQSSPVSPVEWLKLFCTVSCCLCVSCQALRYYWPGKASAEGDQVFIV